MNDTSVQLCAHHKACNTCTTYSKYKCRLDKTDANLHINFFNTVCIIKLALS